MFMERDEERTESEEEGAVKASFTFTLKNAQQPDKWFDLFGKEIQTKMEVSCSG